MTESRSSDEYIELHAASAFSFLAGASQPEALIERAEQLEMPAIALADRNGLYGAARFHTTAKKCGVTAHVGAEIAVSSFGNRLTPPAGCRISSLPSRRVCFCSARRKPAIRTSASSSRASRCAKPPRPKARLRWTIWMNSPPD